LSKCEKKALPSIAHNAPQKRAGDACWLLALEGGQWLRFGASLLAVSSALPPQ